jgi:hypothetical protein
MPFTTGEPVPITPADAKYADTWALDTLEVRVSVPSASAQFAVFCKGELVDTVRGVAAGSDLETNPDVVRLFGELEALAVQIMVALGKIPASVVPVVEEEVKPEPETPANDEPIEEVNDGASE